MAIDPDIKVPYSDPSINAQYSEFLKGEDLEDKYKAEDPLFETIKEEPLTIGADDEMGLTAGSGLWSLSKKQKEARDKQLTKFTDIPDSLAFNWETGEFGTQTPSPTSAESLKADAANDALFSQDDPTGTVSTPSQAFEQAVSPRVDVDVQSSWLGERIEEIDKAGSDTKKAKSIWDVIPERPSSRLRDVDSFYQPYGPTGFATSSSSASGSLSSAPTSSLAGQGNVGQLSTATGLAAANANLFINAGTATGLGTTATLGAGGIGPVARLGSGSGSASSAANFSGAFKAGSQLLQIYSIKQAFDAGTSEGKISGTMQLAALLNPALAPFVAGYEAIKMLTGWGGIGKWFPGGGVKTPMGGMEFRLGTEAGISSDEDNSKFMYPGQEGYDEGIKNDSLRIVAPYSWGYNGYDHGPVKQAAQKQIDYLYGFAEKYGVDINEDVFIKAATGSGGFAKHKPTGDRAPGTNHSVLERIDSVGNGSSTANQWLREVFEYVGPNGEKIVSGTPRTQNINPETGLYEGFNSQEEFEKDVANYNSEFYG
jgi:hypothetical protein